MFVTHRARVSRAPIVVALCLVLLTGAWVGCGEDSSSGASDEANNSEATASTTEKFNLLKPGVIQVGAEMMLPPFASYDEDGNEVGFDIDLFNAMAEKIGLEAEYTKSEWTTIFTALAAGKFDAVLTLATVTEERLQIVDFTQPYFETKFILLIDASKTPNIGSFDDLGDGDVVGVQKGSTHVEWAEENLGPNGVEVKQYADWPSSVLDMTLGRIQGVIGDEVLAPPQIERHPTVEIADSLNTGVTAAFAVKKGNDALISALDKAMDELFEDGTYEALWKKHFPPAIPVPTALPTLKVIPD